MWLEKGLKNQTDQGRIKLRKKRKKQVFKTSSPETKNLIDLMTTLNHKGLKKTG